MIDILLRSGEVIDPSSNLRSQLDVAIRGNKVVKIAPHISSADAEQVIDVKGKLVLPGLIDMHTHIYEGIYENAVNPDLVGVRSGVTTVVDGGSSGCDTFGGFPLHIIPKMSTRILCFLHITRTGIMIQPELSRRSDINLEKTVSVIGANKGLIKGIKLRAIGPAVPTMGIKMMYLAKQAAREANVPLMVHIGDPGVTDGTTITGEVLNLMDAGDIVTHLFTGNAGHILNSDGEAIPEIYEAQSRGVFLDTAFGRFNFSFDIARRSLDKGILPQIISTDITKPGRQSTVFSMVEMLSRFLALGFSLEDVIRMATLNPSKALGMEGIIGTLEEGKGADITVLEEVCGDWVFRDTCGETLTGTKALNPVITIKDGQIFIPDWGPRPWGWLPELSE